MEGTFCAGENTFRRVEHNLLCQSNDKRRVLQCVLQLVSKRKRDDLHI